jgi:hypothetical protein
MVRAKGIKSFMRSQKARKNAMMSTKLFALLNASISKSKPPIFKAVGSINPRSHSCTSCNQTDRELEFGVICEASAIEELKLAHTKGKRPNLTQ